MLDGGLSRALAPTRPHSRMSSPDRSFTRTSLEESGETVQACLPIGRECNCVALAPNGKHAVVGCQDHTLQIWEIDGQVQLHVLRGHKYWVNAVAYSPDGLRIASASADKTIKLWSAAHGHCESTLQGHLLSVASVAFSPDCTQLASASWDKTVCIWDLQLGRVLQTLQGHTDWVHGVSWSPGSWQIASASSDHSVRVWSSASAMVQHVLVGHLQTVSCVNFARKDAFLASGSLDRTVRVWNAQEGSFVARLLQETDEGSVNSVSFTADADRIVIGCSGKSVKVWNFRTGDVEARFVGHEDAVMGVCSSADMLKVLSCSLDKTLRIWKMPSRNVALALPPSLLPSDFRSANQSSIVMSVPNATYTSPTYAPPSYTSPITTGAGKSRLTGRLQEAIQAPSKEMDGPLDRVLSPDTLEEQIELKDKLERSFEEMRRELRQLPTSPAGTLPHELRHLPITPAGSGLPLNGSTLLPSPYPSAQSISTDRALAAMQLGLAGSAASRLATPYSPPPIAFQSLLPAGLDGLGAAGSGVHSLEQSTLGQAFLSTTSQSQRQATSPLASPRFPTSLAGTVTPARAWSGIVQARAPRRRSAENRSLSPVSPVISAPGYHYSLGSTSLTRPVY